MWKVWIFYENVYVTGFHQPQRQYVGSVYFSVKSHYVEFITLFGTSVYSEQRLKALYLYMLLSIYIIDVYNLNVNKISMQKALA